MVLYGIVFIEKEFEADKLVVTDRFVAVTWLELAGYRHTSNNGVELMDMLLDYYNGVVVVGLHRSGSTMGIAS